MSDGLLKKPPGTTARGLREWLGARKRWIGIGLAILVVAGSMVCVSTHRIIGRFLLEFSQLIAVPAALCVVLARFFRDDRKTPGLARWLIRTFVKVYLAVMVLFALYSLEIAVVEGLVAVLTSPIPQTPLALTAFIAFILLAAVVLFYFRLHYKSVYGLSEAIMGLTVATFRLISAESPRLKDPEFTLALVTAGIYLVVRGLTNIHEGSTEDPVALKVRAWFLAKATDPRHRK